MEKQEQEQQQKKSTWDDYVGQIVCLQLKLDYFAVTQPGNFARSQNGDFIHLPLLKGVFGLKKDDFGSLRVTMLTKDPDETQKTAVLIDIDPAMIAYASVAEIAANAGDPDA